MTIFCMLNPKTKYKAPTLRQMETILVLKLALPTHTLRVQKGAQVFSSSATRGNPGI